MSGSLWCFCVVNAWLKEEVVTHFGKEVNHLLNTKKKITAFSEKHSVEVFALQMLSSLYLFPYLSSLLTPEQNPVNKVDTIIKP